MIMAEVAAFDNLEGLIEMAEDLTTFVREAVVEGTAAHKVEIGVWQRVLAMATGTNLRKQVQQRDLACLTCCHAQRPRYLSCPDPNPCKNCRRRTGPGTI